MPAGRRDESGIKKKRKKCTGTDKEEEMYRERGRNVPEIKRQRKKCTGTALHAGSMPAGIRAASGATEIESVASVA